MGRTEIHLDDTKRCRICLPLDLEWITDSAFDYGVEVQECTSSEDGETEEGFY